ncbi:lysophospholipid acyltransferase family protein [bacterium]|nr:lysophospholipid acyltransferase family protein [bacterium]
MSGRVSIKHRIEYLGVRAVILALRFFPHRVALAFGDVVGKLLWHLGIRRKIARRNFDLCLGGRYSPAERDSILRRSYANFVRSMVELARLPKMLKNLDRYVRIEGLELFEKLQDSGRGALLVTGHFGNWELYGAALAKAGLPIDAVVGYQTNPLVDRFMVEYRRRLGMGVIRTGTASVGIYRSLRRGRMVAILADQDARDVGVIVKFCGVPASTFRGTAEIALKTGAPIAVGYIARTTNRITHTAFVVEVIYPDKLPPEKRNVEYITQLFTDILAGEVRKYPTEYFWAHKRFKSTVGY